MNPALMIASNLRGWLFLLVCLFLGKSPSIIAESPGPSKVRYLNFCVKNKDGIYLRDLKPAEVILKLDRKPVEIGYFSYREEETVLVLLLENSPRTVKYPISVPQWGQINPIERFRVEMLSDFFPRLTQLGPALLAQFYREVEVLQEFTEHPDLLLQALYTMKPNYLSVHFDDPQVGRALGRGIDWLRNRPERRKMLVLFTTHIDRESYGNLDEYRDMLRLSETEVYVISDAERFVSGPGYSFEQKMNRYFFHKLVEETSGRVYLTGEHDNFDSLFTDLKGRLTNTYTIGFHTDSADEPKEHSVEVEVLREKCQLSHRRVLVY
jgi:hypothetical protein